ncbi:MAG TPA: short-chain dehydrogenase, partial [Polyangia bacterium]
GRDVQPTPPVYSAEEVAATIVRVARRPRPQVYVGAAGAGLAALRAVAPGFFRRLMARQTARRHLSDRPATTGPGTLFQPMAEGAEVSGGWNGKSVSRRARWLLALGAGLGAGAWYFTRRPETATRRATKAIRRLVRRAA